LMHSVKTGETLAEKVLGKPIFEYFASEPEEGALFHSAMTNFSQVVIAAALQAYDFSGIGTLVDVAGGHGMVLTAVLQKYPAMKGILCDLAEVIPGAQQRIRSLGLEKRCRAEVADFFKSVPAGGDAYIMKHIIHDWNDQQCTTILRNCLHALTAAGKKKGKVLLLESVISADNAPHFAKWLDLEMLVFPGGRERTQAEFAALFEGAGFKLTRVVPTESPLCVIEAVAR
ncbi:MAG TPA: methyltransferase, partial [Terriglobales bacterium]|nr:methyltransferase [Terriglobales bacterium]